MYINFPLAKTKGLIPCEIVLLQLIYQNKSEDMSHSIEVFNEELEGFEQQELVRYVKGNKSSSKFNLVRLSDKGSRILEEIQIPDINNDDLDVYAWLENVYKKSGKEIGNAKKTKSLIAQFRAHSGITRNHLAFLCRIFIKDEKEMEWSQRLEYLFWKKENLFQTRFELDQSRLFQYYLKHKDSFDAKFKEIPN